MIIQVGSTAGSETGVNNRKDSAAASLPVKSSEGATTLSDLGFSWTDSADTSLALKSSEGSTTLSDLSFSLVSNVHVHSNGQRADSVVEG
jgi:hypothetical protein